MLCDNCGKDAGNNKFCPHCGERLQAIQPAFSEKGWVPASFAKGHKTADEAAAALLKETNDKFNDLGLKVTQEKQRTVQQAADVKCGGCGQQVLGQVLEVMNQSWHAECFTCSQCNRPFDLMHGEKFFVRNEQPWCQKCIDWDNKERASMAASSAASKASAHSSAVPAPVAPSAAGGGSTGNINSGATADPKISYAEDIAAYNEIQQGKEYCASCGQVIQGMGVQFGNVFYHEQCFICGCCGKQITAITGFVNRQGSPWHIECHEHSLPTCPRCAKVLDGKVVTVDGIKYHRACFTCVDCNADLGAGYVMRPTGPHCVACANKTADVPIGGGPTVTVKQGSLHQGIRVDPRSGKVTQVQKYCTNCGAVVDTKFCAECGTQLG